jgi:two-component system chemotaxis response regulator CheB
MERVDRTGTSEGKSRGNDRCSPIVVVGASAGGVEALKELIAGFPETVPFAIFVVLHVPAHGVSHLPRILSRYSKLPVAHARSEQPIQPGRVYVAPPNHHLALRDGRVHLTLGPRENNCRPSIDVLFRTAALAHGPMTMAVVLSGTLDDGTAGLLAVTERGGISIVQNPEEAMFSGMPRNAIEYDHVDYILNVAEIAPRLVELADRLPIKEGNPVTDEMRIEADMAELEPSALQNPARPGDPSPFACPECGGVLWELNGGSGSEALPEAIAPRKADRLTRFRCRTGHAYSAKSLLASQSENLENALWIALRALEEKAALNFRLAQQAKARNRPHSANRFDEQEQAIRRSAELVRQLLLTEAEKSPEPMEKDEETEETDDPPIVALCASVGGLQALETILAALPAGFGAAIVVVQHLSPQYPSHLAEILDRRCPLPVKQAENGDRLASGRVYIAPPDHHLLVNPDRSLTLTRSELVHFVRPSADLLLESIAASFRERAIAVILTGSGIDGALGVRAIKKTGGTTVAQNEDTARSFGMPGAAIETGDVDRIVPLPEIAPLLVDLVQRKSRK